VASGDDAHRTIARMTAHYRSSALESVNRPFALLYLRTTEGMREANDAGEFSDPTFWADQVIPTFAGFYLDAYAAWKHGDHRRVDPAWRIAFEASPETTTCTQQIYLGINAHVRNDLAFMIEVMGDRYRHPDHRHVDEVLALRTRPAVYPEIARDLCPGLLTETVPATADRDIFAWRESAWDNAQLLRAAAGTASRNAVADGIRRRAENAAAGILSWNRPAR
jgi:Family of unknown function (DUF5995)